MDIISLFLTIVEAICALSQILLTAFSVGLFQGTKNNPQKSTGQNEIDSERFSRNSKWLIGLCAISFLVSVLLWIIAPKTDWTLLVSSIISIICIISLAIYAGMVKKSFDTDSIIAHKEFWQMVFNKIPSYVEKTSGPYRIILTQVGKFNESIFQKPSDQTKSPETIPDLSFYSVVKDAYKDKTIGSDNAPLYQFEEYRDIQKVPSSQGPDYLIHGIIVFVGVTDTYDSVTKALRKLARSNPYVPIAYCSFTDYPGDCHIPPYTKLDKNYPEDFVNQLILRHYVRSGYWKKLCNKYHHFLKQLSLLALSIIFLLILIWARNSFIRKPLPSSSSKDCAVELTTVFFENDSPTHVKVWVKDTIIKNGKPETVVLNVFNSGDAGVKSKWPNDHESMVRDVISSEVACLWAPKDFFPISIWDKTGNKVRGSYHRKSKQYCFNVGDKPLSVAWYHNPKKNSDVEDTRVRLIYCSDGKYAVEVVYDSQQYYSLSRKFLKSNEFLAKLQQYLLSFKLLYESNAFDNCASVEKIKNIEGQRLPMLTDSSNAPHGQQIQLQ